MTGVCSEKTVSLKKIDGFIMLIFKDFILMEVQKSMENNIFGYARVSSRNQNEERQILALLEMGVPEQNILLCSRMLRKTSVIIYDSARLRVLLRQKLGEFILGDTLIHCRITSMRYISSGR